MVARLSVDTTFLIDLQREGAKGSNGPARVLLRRNAAAELYMSTIVLGEFAEGFATSEHPALVSIRRRLNVLPVDEETSLLYGRVTRHLRLRGDLIGTNDLWIGCTSLRHGLPLATANIEHFGRLDGLDLVDYRSGSAGAPP